MDWKIAALITMLALGVYNILVKKFVENEDWRVMIPIVFVASLALFIYFLTSYHTFADKISTSSAFLSFSLAFVMCVAIAFTYVSFKEGGPLNIVVPIFNLSALITVLISVIFLKDPINLQIGLGILFSLFGMILLLYR
jgi:drug/metabolite transporter (DMT)-like permease